MCLSGRLPEGQNVTGIPARRSCRKVGDAGFPQAGAYLVDKSPASHTHAKTESALSILEALEILKSGGLDNTDSLLMWKFKDGVNWGT